MVETGTILAGVWLVVLWVVERSFPFYAALRGRKRLGHAGRNLGLGALNAILVQVLIASMLVVVDAWGADRGFGLLRVAGWPPWIGALTAFALFDLWMYLWHRANHRIPFLWRFHRVHHGDPRMDVTTGLRFHPGEIALSAIPLSVVIALVGAPLWYFATYETVLRAVVLFHHSNVRLPRRLDRGLIAVVVTPAMHRVHHSRWRRETDSNYGSVFPYWDLLFGSFRLRDDARTIRLGLDELDSGEWQAFSGMLRTPFSRIPRREGTDDASDEIRRRPRADR